jgi:hypothetical protein
MEVGVVEEIAFRFDKKHNSHILYAFEKLPEIRVRTEASEEYGVCGLASRMASTVRGGFLGSGRRILESGVIVKATADLSIQLHMEIEELIEAGRSGSACGE